MSKSIKEMLPENPRETEYHSKSGIADDALPILAAAGLIAAAVILWALFFRKKRHRHRRHRGRPRNPTLAETGGLPAARSNDGSSRA